MAPGGGGGRRVTAVWRVDDAAAPTPVTVPVEAGRTVTAVDVYGAPLGASATVPLSGAPVYVIEE